MDSQRHNIWGSPWLRDREPPMDISGNDDLLERLMDSNDAVIEVRITCADLTKGVFAPLAEAVKERACNQSEPSFGNQYAAVRPRVTSTDARSTGSATAPRTT